MDQFFGSAVPGFHSVTLGIRPHLTPVIARDEDGTGVILPSISDLIEKARFTRGNAW